MLKPGGRFSACVPNAKVFLDGYQDINNFDVKLMCDYQPAFFNTGSRMDIVNYIAYMGREHRFMFDEESLVNRLKMAGFSSVSARPFDSSLDLESRDRYSIYAVAFK